MSAIKVLAIGTSSNRKSINLDLATYAAGLVEEAEVEVISAADFEMPLFSDEREQQLGRPLLARKFMQKMAAADAIVISFAEYNGSYTASFKNLFDWASRIDTKVFQNKPAVFLSTSPGAGGAKSVLAQALQSAKFYGADVIASLSVPRFHENYSAEESGVSAATLRGELNAAMLKLRGEVMLRRHYESIEPVSHCVKLDEETGRCQI